jgi:broad specificity phosphatase PhoE
MKELELRRHARWNREGGGLPPGALTSQGELDARSVGKSMRKDFVAVFFSPAQRASETAAGFLRGSRQPPPAVAIDVAGLASEREDEWRSAGEAAGSGRLDAMMAAAGSPALVAEESSRMAEVVRSLMDRVADGEAALVVGHTPLIEAAVYGLTGVIIEPLEQCEGVNLTLEDSGEYRIQELRLPPAEPTP